jgi:3-hydroxy-9,10-secoandrosta-1,3,5(10)-triene-9,17-dione monooxygenase reductase component
LAKEVLGMAENQLIEAFDAIRSGVYIVTSAYRRKPAGCTVVWLSRVSFKPPLLAVHLTADSHTYETIRRGKRFCVNVLGESCLALARRFGFSSGHHTDKFEDVSYHKSPGGSPILDVAVAYIDCEVVETSTVGDHCMVIGKITAAQRIGEEAPMIYDPATFYLDAMSRIESLEHGAEQS